MKRNLTKLILLVLIVALAATLAACDDKTSVSDDGNHGSDPTPAEFTVRFDANGGNALPDTYNVKVSYGSTVKTPTRGDGSVLIPTRVGYDFAGWVDENGDEFIFEDSAGADRAATRVTDDITLKASWDPMTFTHTLVTTGNISDYPYDGWSYDGTVTFADDEDAVFETTYASDEADIPVPSVTSNDGTEDWFVYWFYVTADGEEVPLTKARKFADRANEKFAPELVGDYTIIPSEGKGLVLYPKLHSQLDDVTVTYKADGLDGYPKTQTAKLGDLLTAPESPGSKDGYRFVGWEYTLTEGEGDDAVEVKKSFVFLEVSESGSDNASSATVLSEDICTESEDGLSFTLNAVWVRTFEVSDESSFKAMYNAITSALSQDDEAAREEVMSADITFTAGSSISVSDLAPLFDEEHPFKGTLTGNDASLTLGFTENYTGGVYALFGASEGSVTGVKLTVNATVTQSVTDAVAGGIALNSGKISACDFKVNVTASPQELSSFVAGGLAARSKAGSSVTDCTAELRVTNTVKAAKAYIGGAFGNMIDGANSAMSKASGVKATLTVVAEADEAYVGGFAGNARTTDAEKSGVLSSSVTVTADSLFFGGFVGNTTGSEYDKCYVDGIQATLTANGNAKAGGFAGYSRAYIVDSRASSEINFTATKGESSLGGFIGEVTRESGSATSSTARGNFNDVYAAGSLTVTANAGSTVYAGGMVGWAYAVSTDTSFTDVKVACTGEGSVTTGAHTARVTQTVTFKDCYYASEVLPTLNGENATFAARDGVSATEQANFTDEKWVNGEDKIDLDRGTWRVVESDGVKVLRLVCELPPEEGDDVE